MIRESIDIQKSFLDFFKNKNHEVVSSSSLIPPSSDKTLLFTNAGMNQFKDYFLDSQLAPFESAVSAQRCVRAGGKHNDLDQVGFTERHLTSFTMLGNFSFKSYFKKEAIEYAWQYLTGILKLEKERLWVTVFRTDDEAYTIWHEIIGISKEKISRLDEKDNFWQMGDTGPCGPCSEIYVDRGIKNEIDRVSFPGDDRSARFMEIWNLVFMEFERLSDGTLIKLAQPGIDTGMGLERLASVIQGVSSVFETDLFIPICSKITELTGVAYTQETKTIFHVLADHIRTAALLIYYGVNPSNEGRGYVLRKIIRRALLFSKKISNNIELFTSLLSVLTTNKNLLCTDIAQKEREIYTTILDESRRFFGNLEVGVGRFTELLKKQNTAIFSGIDAFFLYDTYGFPLEITKILCQEKGIEIDEEAYNAAMEEQRERSQGNQKFKNTKNDIRPLSKGVFLGYTDSVCTAYLKEIFVDGKSVQEVGGGVECVLFFDQTVIYPTGGGQVFDSGYVIHKEARMPILNAKKYNGAIGITIFSSVSFKVGDFFSHEIDKNIRTETERHHSAVHVLYKVLEEYLKGEVIKQVGSFVSKDYFTIDLSIKQEITLRDKEIIESIINQYILEAHPITAQYMTLAEAKARGATADFEGTYDPERVRVIEVEAITKDLCGGCHALNTRDFRLFFLKEIINQGAGIKRFVGIVSEAAFAYVRLLESVAIGMKQQLSCPIEKIEKSILKKTDALLFAQKEKDILLKTLAKREAALLKVTHLDKKAIFYELDPLLKGYEEILITEIKTDFEKIVCFQKMQNKNIYVVVFVDQSEQNALYFSKLEEKFKNKYHFKGKIKAGYMKGTITVNEKFSFEEFFHVDL